MKLNTAIVLVLAASAGMANAASQDEGPDSLPVETMTVRYDAAEVVDRKAAGRLFFRIRQAAEEVCRMASYPRGYEMWEEHACEAEAVAQAVRDADLPALDQYYRRGAGPALQTRN